MKNDNFLSFRKLPLKMIEYCVYTIDVDRKVAKNLGPFLINYFKWSSNKHDTKINLFSTQIQRKSLKGFWIRVLPFFI